MTLTLGCDMFQELCEIHAGFHSQLRKVVAPGSNARLSEVFLNWREKFLIYGDYCANLTNAQNCIQDQCAHHENVNQEVIVSVVDALLWQQVGLLEKC